MNPVTCSQALDGVGSGVAASLRAVDCAAGATAQAAFGRLFGTDGALLPVLTILLTLYVAFFAFSLITGRSRLGISALTPRMITLGLVLTFATSWIAYQGVVWNLAVGAPDQIAGVLMGSPAGDKGGPATQIFADKIDVILSALVDATGQQAADAGAGAGAASTFSPPGLMWLGGTLLLLGTVGVLATCKIALAVLLALGPVFVVMALFTATRGLFTGWLKGVVLLAIAPLFAVLGGSLMLELSVPVVRTLTSTPGQIDARAAMAFFMIGTVHVALMIMVLKVAATMVAGWRVFGLVAERAGEAPARAASLAAAAAA
ncbi:MAG: type IV secretion system protein, partial [Deltaproteobacteria bacterium]|nr:type IV secretion system protein [Deltaproteobacteria bacterium]